ncbi:hypothetical protein [Enterovibrio norvegicus]|uniref:hypothetical protein n=1 Tax=Enterovibrio norvegicus TaxID=188144 RepID=UPI000C82C218|nr:hypothetical protein [Vibrio sp. 10N.286.48.B7]PMH78506.1 hypothetical protein BCU58_09020 [Vibrio sp. 10N.286.48.B7]
MQSSKSYDAIRKQKKESQERFYQDLYASRDDGSYSIDKESLKSELLDPSKLPHYPPKKIPSFD